jgi:hypothetical protein
MPGITYGLVDFVSGGPIIDLPVKKGATWSAQLGRPDSVECSVNMREAAARSLDLRAASAPNKTVLLARTDEDVIVAWGIIGDGGREWDEDKKEVSLSATGIEDSWLGRNPVAPAAVLTAPLTTKDVDGYKIPNPALDTTVSNVSHGTIGKRLVQQLASWPGAPSIFDFPPDEVGTRTQTYSFASLKSVGDALSDLTEQEGGPDFAFTAYRAGLGIRYLMRHGSEEEPRLGSHLGYWSIGGNSPITGLKITDSVAGGSFLGLMSSGKQSSDVLMSRVIENARLADGFPPLTIVDTSRSGVSIQETLDGYNRANVADGARTIQDMFLTVRADASPALGSYRPGDTVTLDVPADHLWLPPGESITLRIMSMSGDEKAKKVKLGVVIVDG